jgi:hypothetical protein
VGRARVDRVASSRVHRRLGHRHTQIACAARTSLCGDAGATSRCSHTQAGRLTQPAAAAAAPRVREDGVGAAVWQGSGEGWGVRGSRLRRPWCCVCWDVLLPGSGKPRAIACHWLVGWLGLVGWLLGRLVGGCGGSPYKRRWRVRRRKASVPRHRTPHGVLPVPVPQQVCRQAPRGAPASCAIPPTASSCRRCRCLDRYVGSHRIGAGAARMQGDAVSPPCRRWAVCVRARTRACVLGPQARGRCGPPPFPAIKDGKMSHVCLCRPVVLRGDPRAIAGRRGRVGRCRSCGGAGTLGTVSRALSSLLPSSLLSSCLLVCARGCDCILPAG